jgi:hypothetical protein
LCFGFTNIDVDGEERSWCLPCMKIAAAYNVKTDERGTLKQCMLKVLGKYLNSCTEK